MPLKDVSKNTKVLTPPPQPAARSTTTHSVFLRQSSNSLGDSFAPPLRSYSLASQVQSLITQNLWMNSLLLFVPLVLWAEHNLYSDGTIFLYAFLALIPLAALLGDFTEDIALRSNDTIGALLNVTFGNATELIISVCALRAGLFEIIKFSLIGSVLGNMLLVLGCAFLAGGLSRHVVEFNADAGNTYSPLLLLASLGFVIPSGYASLDPVGAIDTHLKISREIAVVMCITYVAYIFFQMFTHKQLFEDTADDNEEPESPQYSFVFAVTGLAVVSILISVISDILVDSLKGAAIQWQLSSTFIGIILVPIVGNAAEHATAVVMAMHNKADIAVGVAIGSSIQISMFVMPVLVILGWIMGLPLDLNFHPYATALLIMSILVTWAIISDGKTHWLEGTMLLGAYAMIAIMCFNAKVDMS